MLEYLTKEEKSQIRFCHPNSIPVGKATGVVDVNVLLSCTIPTKGPPFGKMEMQSNSAIQVFCFQLYAQR
jgi:hypothetical protein